tara:strand:+ start:4528 stop:4662 length:135 start_codon:yes stop_codon:yes gene_type:complete
MTWVIGTIGSGVDEEEEEVFCCLVLSECMCSVEEVLLVVCVPET